MKLFDEAEEEAKRLFEQLLDLFKTHPSVDEFHMTSDKQFFIEKTHADGHGTRLINKGVATITRAQIEGAPAAPALAAVAAGDGSLAHPEADAPTPEEIAAKAEADRIAQEGVNTTIAAVEAPAEAAPAAKKAKAPKKASN